MAGSDPQDLTLEANGLRFHALAQGPEDGRLVLLLHGFPELARSWRAQLQALGERGYRAVAPDLRGYGGTDKQGPYDLWTLGQDVSGLVRALGRERATVVGHDWGGGVAYGAALFQPQVVERLVILNCPHPYLMRRELTTNPRQLLRSWYMFFFQLPWLPEALLTRRGSEPIARALRGGSKIREHWTREELGHYRESFSQPGAASAALGYYRAAFRAFGRMGRERGRRISAPTLILWGREDRFLGTELLAPEKLAPYWEPGHPPEVRFIDGAGHFVQNEAPRQVSEALLEWLAGQPAAVAAATSFS